MSDKTTPRQQQIEVAGAPIRTGMSYGVHTWFAIILTSGGVVLSLVAQSFTDPALALLFLAGAIGLLGEVPHLMRTGEVWARQRRFVKSNRFLHIRRADSPVRFMFYIVTYTVLGLFSLVIAVLFLWSLAAHYVG